MARIRTVKPEFPQSESMGNVSRDARLTFVLLWTLADDEGRLRGNSRMLASLLFPYDDDAPALIDTWLAELEKEGCIVRYKHESATYIQIHNWLIHQKIDRPSKSKIPQFDERSQTLANAREDSLLDQGSRIKDQGSKDQEEKDLSAPKAQTDPDDVLQVFAHWQAVMSSPRSLLDDKRRKLIRNALKTGYSVDQLKQAIDGCAKSAWHMGQNDRMTKYNGLDLILRNAEHIDKFMLMTEQGAKPRPSEFDLSRYGSGEVRRI